MIGELLGGMMDEFNSMSMSASEKTNKGMLKGAYMIASTGGTISGWNATLAPFAAMTMG